MYFDEFKHQLPDIDPAETEDWLTSLDQVVAQEGEMRARFLMYKLLKRARQLQIGLPPLTQTRYINTISPEQEPSFPGDEELERRIRRLIRWNAVAMVLRANNQFSGIGGHLATYASAATLYEVGFNHFFRGKDDGASGDQIFYQGHAAPGIYARAFLEGRLSVDQLDHFRRETGGPGTGLSSYPHPRLMPEFWEYPTVSMGLAPISAIYQARYNRYLHNRGMLDTSGLARLGVPRRRRDRRARIARCAPRRVARRPRQPDLRRQLQPPATGRPGARQRQDHPGARVRLPRRRLERDQGHLGPRVGRPARARRGRPPRPADERDPRRRVPEVLGRRRRLHPRALLRPRRAAAQARRAPVRRRPGQAPPRRPRLPQGLRGLQGRDRAQGRPDGHPRPHGQGLDARPGRRGPQHHPPGQEAQRGRAQDLPRPARAADPGRRRSRKRPTTTRAPTRTRSST